MVEVSKKSCATKRQNIGREREYLKKETISPLFHAFSFLVFVHIAHAKQQASQADRQTDRQAGSKQTSHHHQKLQKKSQKIIKQASKQASREGRWEGGIKHQASSKVGWAAGKHLKWNLLQVDQKASIVNKKRLTGLVII